MAAFLHILTRRATVGPSSPPGRLLTKRVLEGIFFIPMEFEFDVRKSRSNRKKHGIDFEEAQHLWDDPNRIEIPARTTDEPRFLVVGFVQDVCWSAVITYRGDRIRINSVRRSRAEEVESYERD